MIVCRVTNLLFSLHSGHLRQHQLSHPGEKSVVCSTCKKSYSQSGEMKRHMRLTAGRSLLDVGSVKIFYPELTISKIILRVTQGRSHMHACTVEKKISVKYPNKSSTDSGENNFECSTCEKSFFLSRYLKAHIKTHTGEETSVCPHCVKVISTAGQHKVHTHTHTGV